MADAPPPYDAVSVGSEKKPMAGGPPGTVPPPMGQSTAAGGYSMPAQPTTIIVTSPMHYGPYSQQLTCPHCQVHVMTEITPVTGLLTWIVAGALLFFGCWCGCCLIPFCTESCQDIEHRCPNCHQFLGMHKRIN